MAHTDAHGFNYDKDILDVIKSNEQVSEILELLNMNPWNSSACAVCGYPPYDCKCISDDDEEWE